MSLGCPSVICISPQPIFPPSPGIIILSSCPKKGTKPALTCFLKILSCWRKVARIGIVRLLGLSLTCKKNLLYLFLYSTSVTFIARGPKENQLSAEVYLTIHNSSSSSSITIKLDWMGTKNEVKLPKGRPTRSLGSPESRHLVSYIFKGDIVQCACVPAPDVLIVSEFGVQNSFQS